MIDKEEWLMMKALYMQGVSIKEIAKRTGRDRKTVAKYVHGDSNPPAFKKPEGKKPRMSRAMADPRRQGCSFGAPTRRWWSRVRRGPTPR